MSSTAPWLALAVDWDESEMWDAIPEHGIEEATDGERLAWICLMCDAKKKGRGGRVSIRKSVFQREHRLSGRSVEGLLKRAQKCRAVEIDGDTITLCNWGTYQDKKGGRSSRKTVVPRKARESQGSAVPITTHPSPITHHHPLPPASEPSRDPSDYKFEPLPAEWSEVVEVVRDCGVGDAATACEKARGRGATPTEVRLACKHFSEHPGAWNPGLLYKILCGFQPGQKISWPEPRAEYIESQKREARTESRKLVEDQTKKRRSESDEYRKKKAADLKRMEQLESLHGLRLDTMTDDERRALCEKHCPKLLVFLKPGKVTSPNLRMALLEAFEKLTPTPTRG